MGEKWHLTQFYTVVELLTWLNAWDGIIVPFSVFAKAHAPCVLYKYSRYVGPDDKPAEEDRLAAGVALA